MCDGKKEKMKLILIVLLALAIGCTISVTTVNSHGTASDVVDENQKAEADISPTVSMPALTKKPGSQDTGLFFALLDDIE